MTIQRRYGGFSHPPRGTPVDEHSMAVRLRRARRIAKVTSRELADLLGIEVMTIRRIENGHRTTRPKSLKLVEMWVTRIEPRVEDIHGDFDGK